MEAPPHGRSEPYSVTAALCDREPPTRSLGVTQSGLAQDVPGKQALAWNLTVTGPAIREFIYVDAINGGLVEQFTGIYHGKDRRNYNNLAQADYSKAVKCRFEGDAPSGDPDCDNAYVYSGDTYDFFNKGFGRCAMVQTLLGALLLTLL